MDFGITIKPDIHIDRIVSLTQQAEASGFSYGWIFDSHVIWKEPFPLLTLMAASTQTMRLGHLRHESRRPRCNRFREPLCHVEPRLPAAACS